MNEINFEVFQTSLENKTFPSASKNVFCHRPILDTY